MSVKLPFMVMVRSYDLVSVVLYPSMIGQTTRLPEAVRSMSAGRDCTPVGARRNLSLNAPMC
jgi:hypothetical protein